MASGLGIPRSIHLSYGAGTWTDSALPSDEVCTVLLVIEFRQNQALVDTRAHFVSHRVRLRGVL